MRKLRQHAKTATKLALLFAMTLSLSTPYSIYANDGESNQTSEQAASTVQRVDAGQSRATDVTKPVIDKVEFPNNGQTLKPGDIVPIYVTAHDYDSGIKEVYADIYYNGEDIYDTERVYLTLNEQTDIYEGNICIKDGGFTSGYIENVHVADNIGNYAEGEVSDENHYEYYYKFDITPIKHDSITYNVKSITVDQQGTTLHNGDSLHIKIIFNEEIRENTKRLEVTFYNKESNDVIKIDSFDFDEKTAFGEASVSNNVNGKYEFKSISGISENGAAITFNMDQQEEAWFYVEGEIDNERPKITSIEMDKVGETLKAGETINFSIKATDNEVLQYKNNYIRLSPVANVDHALDTINLVYNQADNTFKGSFVIPDNMYPCEWYLSEVDIRDLAGNYTYLYDYTGNIESNPFYFNVIKDGTFTNPTYDVKISFCVLDKNGNYNEIKAWNKDNVERRTTLKDAGLSFPDGSTTYEGLVFKGWRDAGNNAVDENTQITKSTHYNTFYAVYDKQVINTTYYYPNSDLKPRVIVKNSVAPYGITYRELLNKIGNEMPEDLYVGDQFDGWQYENFIHDEDTLDSIIADDFRNSFTLKAFYKDKIIVETFDDHYTEKGTKSELSEYLIVNKGTTYSDVLQQLKNKAAPKSFKGLRFKYWNIEPYDEDVASNDVIDDYAAIYEEAVYENYIVRFIIDPMFADYDTVSTRSASLWFNDNNVQYLECIVAEPGEQIKVPAIPEYKSLTWVRNIPEGENLIITKHTDFLGYGEKSDSKVDPDDTDKEEKPDNKPDDNKNETTPSKKLDQETIKEIIDEVKKTPAGKTVEVDMGQASVVPEEVLESIKGKDVTVNLNMGAYTWSINGKDIKSLDLKSIDLEVKFDSDAVPSKLIKDLAGDQPVKKLSLTHNGDFGFKANLTFNIGKEYEGKYGNLYYYDSEGRLVFMNAGKIDANGNVGLSFSHASEYVIVIADKVATENNTNDETNNTDNTPNGSQPDETKGKGGKADTVKPAVKPADTTKTNTAKTDSKTPNTGDSTNNNAFVMLLLVSGVAIALIAWNRKRHVNEAE